MTDSQIVYQVPFTQIPNWVFGQLSSQEAFVLLALLSFGTTDSFPSHATLGEMVSLSAKQVARILLMLRDKKIIRWSSRTKADNTRTSNLYEVFIWDLARDSYTPASVHIHPRQRRIDIPASVCVTPPPASEEQYSLNNIQLTREEEPPKKIKSKVLKKDELLQNWIESAPVEFSGYLEQVKAWLEQRWEIRGTSGRKDPWGIHQRSTKALRHAIYRKVADEFLSLAAERGWLSLGFNGWESTIDRMANPQGKAFKPDPLDTPRSSKKEFCMEWRSHDAAPDSKASLLSIADLTPEHATTGTFFFAGETPATVEAKKIITEFRTQAISNGADQ